jgi:hypothetical protein
MWKKRFGKPVVPDLTNACGDGNLASLPTRPCLKYTLILSASQQTQTCTYVLSKNMDISEIVDNICEGNPPDRR